MPTRHRFASAVGVHVLVFTHVSRVDCRRSIFVSHVDRGVFRSCLQATKVPWVGVGCISRCGAPGRSDSAADVVLNNKHAAAAAMTIDRKIITNKTPIYRRVKPPRATRATSRRTLYTTRTPVGEFQPGFWESTSHRRDSVGGSPSDLDNSLRITLPPTLRGSNRTKLLR